MARRAEPRRLTIVRYHLADGTRCRADTPGAVRAVTESETYYATIDGVRVSLGTAVIGEAWGELERRLLRAQLRKQGIHEDRIDAAAKTFDQHRLSWVQAVEDGGATADHVKLIGGRVKALARVAGWLRLSDVTAESCLAALARLVRVEELSVQSRNHYLSAAKQFLRWCVTTRRLLASPLVGIQPINVEASRAYIRRSPTLDEVQKLLTFLASPAGRIRRASGKARGPHPSLSDGPSRAMLYKVAMGTGLRASELRSLCRESFDLDAGTVTVEAAYSKHRRRDTLPMPPWLVSDLAAYFAGGGACWPGLPCKAGRMLQADLAAAGVAHKTTAGVLDMHSFRVLYISELSRLPGVTIKRLMSLARHSTPTLTLKTYARVELADLSAVTDSLPDPGRLPTTTVQKSRESPA